MMRPRLLDLYCGAGGSARGYQQAGFHVTGVDIAPQLRYAGDAFIQDDALAYAAAHGHEYEAINASPPCQFASIMRNLPWLRNKDYPALIRPTRDLLIAIGKPWVIENVYSARWGSKQLAKYKLEAHGMQAGWLCGTMFGRPFYRHRVFETSFYWLQPAHPRHMLTIRNGRKLGSRASDVTFANGSGSHSAKVTQGVLRRWSNGAQKRGCGIGHAAGIDLVRQAMEIDWMTRDEITQAMPPCYTEFIGRSLIRLSKNSVALLKGVK